MVSHFTQNEILPTPSPHNTCTHTLRSPHTHYTIVRVAFLTLNRLNFTMLVARPEPLLLCILHLDLHMAGSFLLLKSQFRHHLLSKEVTPIEMNSPPQSYLIKSSCFVFLVTFIIISNYLVHFYCCCCYLYTVYAHENVGPMRARFLSVLFTSIFPVSECLTHDKLLISIC